MSPAWDDRQREVIEAPCNARLLVRAGPGEGKTAVACARVAHLVGEDVTPSRILFISFTRTAVAEIRNRIRAYVRDERAAAEIRISTIDSHAWQLRVGFDTDRLPSLLGEKGNEVGYDVSIERVIALLEAQEPVLVEYLGDIEHVVVDEAQDVVDRRAILIERILRSLSPNAGITIFADPAQAIYGFTTDERQASAPSGSSQPQARSEQARPAQLLELLRRERWKSIRELPLGTIYRTTDSKIRKLFRATRRAVTVTKPADNHIEQIEETIIAHAGIQLGRTRHEQVPTVCQQAGEPQDQLVLFRRRADVLMASSYCSSQGLEHRLRLSGLPVIVRPFLGWLLCEHTSPAISRAAFDALWAQRERRAPALFAGESVEASWRMLHNLAPARGKKDTLSLEALQALVARPKPPLELCTPDHGTRGPLLGTIHASKGREAPYVVLLLQNRKQDDDGEDEANDDADEEEKMAEILEEGRVLYVGATRARERLAVGQGAPCYAGALESGRVFRSTRKPGRYQIEVGRAGDVDALLGLRGEDAGTAQAALAALAGGMHPLVAFRAKVLDDWRYVLQLDGDAGGAGPTLGYLSRGFEQDRERLWTYAKKRMGPVSPPSCIPFIYLVGLTTVAFREDERKLLDPPYRESGFALAPVIRGFSIMAFSVR